MKMGADNKLSAIKDGPELFNVAQAVRIAQLVADKPKSRAGKWAARSAHDGLMGDASNKFRHLPGIKRATRNAVIRVSADRFIGNAILKLWGKATSSACPHCHRGYDNGFHVVSNCGNSQMRGTLTFRHDKAVHILVDFILKAAHAGPFHLFVSAGRRYADSTETLGATIPAWLYGGEYSGKPDLVLIEGWDESMPVPTEPTADIRVTIIDLTYGQGDTSTARITRKQTKSPYADLVPHLRKRGWSVVGFSSGTSVPDPSFHSGPHKPPTTETVFDLIGVISLGTTGEIYESTARTIAALAIPHTTVATSLTALHRSTIEFFPPTFPPSHFESGSVLTTCPSRGSGAKKMGKTHGDPLYTQRRVMLTGGGVKGAW